MIALLVGIVFIAFAVVACLPAVLNWWPQVIQFLMGSLPVVALLVGLVAVFIGIADLKDRAEAKKEEAEEAKEAATKKDEKKS